MCSAGFYYMSFHKLINFSLSHSDDVGTKLIVSLPAKLSKFFVSYSRASIQIQNVDTSRNFCCDLGQPFHVLLHLLNVNLSQ